MKRYFLVTIERPDAEWLDTAGKQMLAMRSRYGKEFSQEVVELTLPQAAAAIATKDDCLYCGLPFPKERAKA